MNLNLHAAQNNRSYRAYPPWRGCVAAVFFLAPTMVQARASEEASLQLPPTEAPPSPTDSLDARKNAEGELQQIVVTAQKRLENLQNVPLSIVAITANDAQLRGLTNTQSLTAAVPGLVITSPANVGNPYLRGIGSALFDPSAEQGVAMYVDGVYIAAPQTNLFSFNNIQQVEVLRGPQGTLFGRNATGGVIQITTRRPSTTAKADFSAGLGNYNTTVFSAYATGGIASNLAIDFAGLYENQGKGFGRNLTLNRDQFHQARGNYSLRSKILFEPSASTVVTLAADYAHAVSTNAYQKPEGVISPIDGSTYPGRYNSLNDYYTRNRVNTGGASLRINQEIGQISLMNIVSYRKTDVQYDLDNDVTRRPVANVQLNPASHNWSEEIQISNSGNKSFKWMLGGYYFYAVGQYQSVIINGLNSSETKQKSISYAVFGQATARILPKTELTIGLRYTTEDQDFTQSYPVSRMAEQNFHKVTYRAAINQWIAPEISLYASYNRGFKSGGYNLRLPGNSFRPETIDAYEIGLKSELFDRRLRLNVGGFYYDDKNVQVLSSFLGGTITSNAAAASIKGIEAEFEAAVTRTFRLSGALSFQHGEYARYPDGLAFTANGIRLPPQDQSGNKTIVTPPFSGTLTGSYEAHLGDGGSLQPAVTVAYNDGFFWQSDNRLVQPAYTLLNASLLWTSASKKFDASLWAKNIANAKYYVARLGVTGLGDVQQRAAPFTFGLTLGVHM